MKDHDRFDVVTGAFGYSGRIITERLLEMGRRIRTLTNSPERANPFGATVEVHPYRFDDPDRLARSLTGARILYNTYWIRFDHARFRQADAVENTQRLFEAARRAGIERVVHVSITNPSEDSPLAYFSGKARLERALVESGLPHSILRPAVLFGHADILVNNIAWMLRRFPFFGLFGDGEYQLQPIHVEDFADLAIEQSRANDNRILNAIGPETFTYRELVEAIGAILGLRRPIVSIPKSFGYWIGAITGKMVGDVIITRDEIEGLTSGLLSVDSPPTGRTKLTDWARAHRKELGVRYASELKRRIDRKTAYDRL